MFAIGIRYLTGFVVASHGTREQVEWPPHPARVFMAMVAAHYQTGADNAEREALLWLEKQPPPKIHAPDAWPPDEVVMQYVPVNDKAGPSKALIHSLPLARDRQPRVFARAALADDKVFLHWPDAVPESNIREAMAKLCAKVTRIGHSISLVQMWLPDSIPNGLRCYVPDQVHGTHQFRVPREGTLSEVLDPSFNREAITRYMELLLEIENAPTKQDKAKAKKKMENEFPQGEPRHDWPRISTYVNYTSREITGKPPAPNTIFSPHLPVFILERRAGSHRCLDLLCTLILTDRWREAMASHANGLSREAQALISGHAADGAPMQTPHLAFLPLGVIGHPNADGRLSGIALAFPNDISPEIRKEIFRAADMVCTQGLMLGRLGTWNLQLATMARQIKTLRAATWTAHPNGATHWGSVTPIAFDHHPKAKDKTGYMIEAAEMVRTACRRIGLPSPGEVIPTPVSAHLGVPPAHAFPRLRRKDGSERCHTHAIIIFDKPVCGPIVIGAGRYRGYGLFRPIEVHT